MGYQLFLGDCLEVMRGMKDKSVDAIITSPPYNMRTRIRNGKYTEREKSEHFSRKYDDFHDSMPIDEYSEFHRQVLGECLRLARVVFVNIQFVTGSKEAWFRLMGEFSKYLKDVIVWDKGEGQPAMHPSVINRGYELILAFESSAMAGRAFSKSFFGRGTMPDVWRFGRGGNGAIRGHSAVFPVELAGKIIVGWTQAGEKVFDPFMGSGTTGVACVNLGRNFIGCEISPKYYAIAERRISQAQPPLFTDAGSTPANTPMQLTALRSASGGN